MKNSLKSWSVVPLLAGFLACGGQKTSDSKALSLYDDIYPLWHALEKDGSETQLRFVTIDEQGIRKCLTDVSQQAFTQRDVAWNTCTTDINHSDYALQIWTMRNARNSASFSPNEYVVFRDVVADPGYATYLQVGDDVSQGDLKQNKLVLKKALFSQGNTLPENRFGTFNHYGDITGIDPVTGKWLSVNTLQRITYDSSGALGACVSKASNAQSSSLGAFLIEFKANDWAEMLSTAVSNCADIQFELIRKYTVFAPLIIK